MADRAASDSEKGNAIKPSPRRQERRGREEEGLSRPARVPILANLLGALPAHELISHGPKNVEENGAHKLKVKNKPYKLLKQEE